ncbi:ankyrin repeat domain-containing protein, partial [Pseudoalteromonas sp. '520P1 No. 412']
WTPLLSAVSSNKVSMVKALIKAGADVNKAGRDGWAPLHWTVNSQKNQKHDGRKLAQLLIKAGANLNQKTSSGSTPLRLAVSNNRLNEFNVLLSAKANTN